MASDPKCSSVDELTTKTDDKPEEPQTSNLTLPSHVKSSSVPRDDLIGTAVHFLQNPRVQKSPVPHKRAFLLKKGLTETEVNIALERAGSVAPGPTGFVPNQAAQQQVPGHGPAVAQAMVPWQSGPHFVGTSPSIWHRWREFCSSAVVIGATCYGVYYLYKQYLEPALIGREKAEEDRLDRVERHLLELNKSLSQLRSSLVTVETSLAKQASISKQELGTDTEVQDMISLAEIKAEISSIKALLLSRKQFPATPQLSANIPAWQLENKEDGSKDSTTEETVPKQVLEDHEEEEHAIPNGVTVNGISGQDE